MANDTTLPLSGASSDIDSESTGSSGSRDILFDEPIFHVLSQFLVSGDKNIADILAQLVKEVALLRETVGKMTPK